MTYSTYMTNNKKPRPRRAMVLFTVLIVVTMVGLAGFSFAELMLVENKAVHLHGDQLQLENVAASGEQLLGIYLQAPLSERHELIGTRDRPDIFRGMIVLPHTQPARRARVSIISSRYRGAEIVGARFGVENESRRLNLAVLSSWEKQHPGSARRALSQLPGIEPESITAILAWLGINSPATSEESSADGAQANSTSYGAVEPGFGANSARQGIGNTGTGGTGNTILQDALTERLTPVPTRQGVPETIEELLLVKGVSRRQLLGADADQNGRTDEAESYNASMGADELVEQSNMPPWAAMLTLYSEESNRTPDRQPRINLNGEDLVQLHTQLTTTFDDEWANFVIAFRQYGKKKSSADSDAPDFSSGTFEVDLERPAKRRIKSMFDLLGAQVHIKPDKPDEDLPEDPIPEEPIVLHCPLKPGDSEFESGLNKLLDNCTVNGKKTIRGRINIDLAPREVLLAIPTMDATTVEKILQSRESRQSDGADGPPSQHAVWLLSEQIVDLPRMKELFPYITGGGDVYRAQIVACFDRWGPINRAEMVLNASGDSVRRVYWKDLQMLGAGFSRKALGAVENADPLSADASGPTTSQNFSPTKK